jgi:hypothetical protein
MTLVEQLQVRLETLGGWPEQHATLQRRPFGRARIVLQTVVDHLRNQAAYNTPLNTAYTPS